MDYMMTVYRLAVLAGALVCACDSVHVTVREKQRFAMLFQSIVLPCNFQTASIQTPVVQWWYKSYCHDRTRDSFSLPESLGIQASELGTKSHLDCSDSSRTVRIVASAQGSSLTLAEHYKGRDISIVNKAELRIGELQWGDSGVYFCKVIISDDLEGKNEAQVELLVLGRTGQQDDILPEFDVEIMPEWAFVGSVVLGSILVLLLLGICWCQCCPHSCCCYVSCCCCPDTCCCPRHLYEAGKMAKSGQPPQAVYPYYIPWVPSAVPIPSSSQLDPKTVSISSLENNLAGASSLSELSSLHDGGNIDFRHTYQTVQMKALPPITDTEEPTTLRVSPQYRRPRRARENHSDDETDRRWKHNSEYMQKMTLNRRGRTGSLDELEEFARSHGSRGRRLPDHPPHRDHIPPRHFCRGEDDSWGRRSPSPLPQKRRDTWDSDRPPRLPQHRGYDNAYLNSILESKARRQGEDRGACRVDEDSDTPSKGSSRGKGSSSYYSRSPSNRPEDEDPLPPYCENELERYRRASPSIDRYHTVEPTRSERYRTTETTMKSFSQQGTSHTLQGGRQGSERSKNLVSYL